MTQQNRAQFIVDLTGNVAQRARQFGASIRSLGADGSRSMRLFGAGVGQANKVLDKFDNKFVGFATGGGLLMATKHIGNQQQQLVDLATTYNLTAEQVNNLNEAVWQTSGNRKIPYADMIAAADAFLERTNDYDAFLAQIDNIALSIKGLGLDANTAGKSLGVLFTKGASDSGDMLALLDGIASLQSIGTGNLPEQLSGLINLSTGTGWQKPEQLLQLLALQRMGDAEFGNSSQATGALQSYFEAIKDPAKQRLLKRNGVDIFSDKKTGALKNPADLLMEIGTAAKHKERNLDDVFSGDMLKLAMSFANSDKRAAVGNISTITGLIDEKATQTVQTFNGALASLLNAGERFAQLNLAGPVQALADAINALSPEELQNYANTVKNIAMGVGAVIGARYAYRGYKGLSDLLKDPKKAGGGLPGAGSELGAVPVYVTNWEDSNGNSSGNDYFKNDGLLGKAAAYASNVAWYAPDPAKADEMMARLKANDDEHIKQVYGDSGLQPKNTMVPYVVDKWLQERDAKMAEALKQAGDAFEAKQQEKNGKSTLTIQIDSGENLRARTTSVKSDNFTVNVETGNTYSGVY